MTNFQNNKKIDYRPMVDIIDPGGRHAYWVGTLPPSNTTEYEFPKLIREDTAPPLSPADVSCRLLRTLWWQRWFPTVADGYNLPALRQQPRPFHNPQITPIGNKF